MDDRILKYIEHKKLYYEELEEAAKITPEEEKIRDLCLATSDAIKKSDYSEVAVKFDELGHVLDEIMNKSKFKIQKPDIDSGSIELPNTPTVPKLDSDKFLSLPADSKEEASTNPGLIAMLDILYALAVEFGACVPFGRLHFTVALEKAGIKELCQKEKLEQYNEDVSALLCCGEDKDLIKDIIDDLTIDLGGDRGDVDKFINPCFDMISSLKEVNLPSVIGNGVALVREMLQDVFMYIKGEDPIVGMLNDKEKKAFDSIIHQPFMEPVINKMMETIKEEAEQDSVEDETFTLPDNYFSGISPSTNRKEYFTSTLWGDKCCVEDFVDLINYIADRGFIENNKATKQLLAFRLTGRLRPDGELPKIKWNGKAAKGADCIFLLKCTDAKPKYPKMKEFFEADFPTKYFANNASVRFMEKLHELFPEIYKLPNKYKEPDIKTQKVR